MVLFSFFFLLDLTLLPPTPVLFTAAVVTQARPFSFPFSFYFHFYFSPESQKLTFLGAVAWCLGVSQLHSVLS